jgi:hypothetical protein
MAPATFVAKAAVAKADRAIATATINASGTPTSFRSAVHLHTVAASRSAHP